MTDTSQAREGLSLLDRRAKRIGRYLCLLAAALGATGFLEWLTGMTSLAVFIPGQPQMKANTSLSLLLLGLAGALRSDEAPARAIRIATGTAAFLVLAAGAGTLVEYALGVDLPIDRLFRDSSPGRYPGRPSPATALALTLLASALLSFDVRLRARARPSEWMILTAALVGFVALVGAAFGASPLYGMRSAAFTGVGVPTALALLFISVGMLLERPDGGVASLTTSPGPGGALLRRLVLPGVALPTALGFGLSRLFAFLQIHDVALLFATLIATTTVIGLALLASSARPLDEAHRALAVSRAETRALVQQAPDGIFVADLDGRYIDVNRAGCELLGFSREELVGKSIVDLIPPEDVQRLATSKHPLLEGSSEVTEWTLRRKDGAYLPVEVNAKMLPDGRVQAFVRDITDRRRAAGALRASEARYSGLVSIAADAIISVDEDQRIVIYNQGAEHAFGWTASEVLGKPLDMLIPERFRERHRQHVRNFAAQPEQARPLSARSDVAGLRKNGEEFPAEAAISKLQTETGLIFTAVLRDVTEQRRTAFEEKFFAEVGSVLAKTLAFEETLVNVGTLAVGALADVCVLESAENGGALRRLVVHGDAPRPEAPPESIAVPCPLLRRSVLETNEPLLLPEVTGDLVESLIEDAESSQMLRVLAPRSLIAVPLVARGRRTGSLILTRSATSPPYLPRDLSVAQELGRRAALALENARLYRLATSAVRARDDVLGIVAHDLRNPLDGIAMQAELLLRQRQGDPVAQRAAERIQRGTGRMNRLIQDLLDVVCMESGHLSIATTRQATAPLLLEVLEAQKPFATAASIALTPDLSPELPEVCADRDRLAQVFENLIGNAVKFCPPGSRITAGARARECDVLFWIADDGPGIPAESVEHVFDRFWQAKRADRRGAGLGLPIVKGIVEAHGGRIWVDTTPGRGTTFFFTIPTAPPDAAWQATTSPAAP